MKKISRKIAMLLVLVMLAGSFTSCFTVSAIKNDPVMLFLAIPMDVITFPFQLIGLACGMNIFEFDIFASAEMETRIYLANAEYSSLPEYYSLSKKIYSLPEAELASLKQIYNSIPETEVIALMERFASLSEIKRVSLVTSYISLPESEIISSIKRTSFLPETEHISLLRTFNSLSDAELDALVEEINSKSKTENVVFADNFNILPKTNIVSLKNDLQYYNGNMRLCFYY
jgi:hypothetical protein